MCNLACKFDQRTHSAVPIIGLLKMRSENCMDKRMERRVRRQRMAGFLAAVGVLTYGLLKILGLV